MITTRIVRQISDPDVSPMDAAQVSRLHSFICPLPVAWVATATRMPLTCCTTSRRLHDRERDSWWGAMHKTHLCTTCIASRLASSRWCSTTRRPHMTPRPPSSELARPRNGHMRNARFVAMSSLASHAVAFARLRDEGILGLFVAERLARAAVAQADATASLVWPARAYARLSPALAPGPLSRFPAFAKDSDR